eukprot:270047-Chlamydomonas_euryale.AAC.6
MLIDDDDLMAAHDDWRVGGGLDGDSGRAADNGLPLPPIDDEQFPSLAAAAATPTAGAVPGGRARGGGAIGAAAGAADGRMMHERAVRCDCGRRMEYLAVPQAGGGGGGWSLPCDAGCEAARADERERAAASEAEAGAGSSTPRGGGGCGGDCGYSVELLAAALERPEWWAALTCQLDVFMSDARARRLGLSPMPRAERALVHALAEDCYALVPVEVGAEPECCLQLYKNQRSAAPAVGLADAAYNCGLPEVAAAAAARRTAVAQLTLHVSDIAPGTDLTYFLKVGMLGWGASRGRVMGFPGRLKGVVWRNELYDRGAAPAAR